MNHHIASSAQCSDTKTHEEVESYKPNISHTEPFHRRAVPEGSKVQASEVHRPFTHCCSPYASASLNMARKRSGKSQGGSKPKGAGAPGSRINRIENYEDTLEEGGVDDCGYLTQMRAKSSVMFKRDQIMFDQDNGDDDDDVNADEGEEVFALDLPKKRRSRAEDEDFEDDEEGDDVVPTKKGRKEKKKMDVSGKGRFGKPIEDSDEEDEAEGSGSSDEDDEGWGRQYYSKPSNRRAKEDEDAYDEQREEDREMEEREVKRLQRKAREAFGGEEDWGLEEVPAAETR